MLHDRLKEAAQALGITRGEEKLLTDVAGVFVDIFRRYNDELKKIKQEEKGNERATKF